MTTLLTGETLEQPLLLSDAHPWYEVPTGYDGLVESCFAPLGLRTMGAAETHWYASELVRRVLEPGDLVVIPLMCGALLEGAAREHAGVIGAEVVSAPLSRHPFVSLSADAPDQLVESCKRFAESTSMWEERFFTLLQRSGNRVRRIVYLDSNSATGRDFVLFRELVRYRVGREMPMHFSVLVSETAHDEERGPGHRGGPKAKVPDSAAVRLIGSNTKFLSHLRFLRRGLADRSPRPRSCARRCPR